MDWVGLESTAFTITFVSSFLLLAVWESWYPARPLKGSAERRWVAHATLFAGAVIFQSLLIRTTPLLLAAAVADKPWGLRYGNWLPWPAQFAMAILLLDLTHYGTHRLFHAFRLGWRIHEVHHSDVDFDVSLAVRFHPLEVAVSRMLYLVVVGVLAPPLAAVFFSEVHTTLLDALVHANISWSPRLERVLRLVFITPELHRIHHSSDVQDQNCNFGQTLVWWDRFLGTYRARARLGSEEFKTGVADLPKGSYEGIVALFAAPFQRRCHKGGAESALGQAVVKSRAGLSVFAKFRQDKEAP